MEEEKEAFESKTESEVDEHLLNEFNDVPGKSILKQEDEDEEAATSYDLLRQVLIKRGLPMNVDIDDLVPGSPKGKLSHEQMFGDNHGETIQEDTDHLVPVPNKQLKLSEEEIAIITGKKTRK
jgi:hypothetical protein